MESFKNTYQQFLAESTKQGKLLVQQGKLSPKDFNSIVSIDPTPQKKYVGWMSKQWADHHVSNLDELRNNVEEWNSFSTRGKTKNRDIYAYKTFDELKAEVHHLNQSGEGISVKDLESDFEVVRDDDQLLVMTPHTHEASRKLGLSHFAYRDCEGGGRDSAWCTTYKAPDHFNDYYYKHNVTFYYVKVRSQQLISKLKSAEFGPEYVVVAIAVMPDELASRAESAGHSKMDAYDALDNQFQGTKLEKYLSIIGLQ